MLEFNEFKKENYSLYFPLVCKNVKCFDLLNLKLYFILFFPKLVKILLLTAVT